MSKKRKKLAKTKIYTTSNFIHKGDETHLKVTVWDDYNNQFKKVFAPTIKGKREWVWFEKWLDEFITLDEARKMAAYPDAKKVGMLAVEFFIWTLIKTICKRNKWGGRLWMVSQNVDVRVWDWEEGDYTLTYNFKER